MFVNELKPFKQQQQNTERKIALEPDWTKSLDK